MNRRSFGLGLGAAIAGAAALPAALAQPGSRTVDASRVFDRLADYYGLPAAERSHFHPVYALKAAKGATPALFLTAAGARRVLSLDSDGRVLNPPTAAELQAGAQVIVAGQTQMSSNMSVEPVLALGATMQAAGVIKSLEQANNAIGRFAGLMSFMAPRVVGVAFVAPRTAAGTATLKGAQRVALPYVASRFEFRPLAAPGAGTLNFLTAPSSAAFLQ